MADAGIDYNVLRLEQELEVRKHEDTIAHGAARLAAIERQIDFNNALTALNNRKLQAEVESIGRNETSLRSKIAELRSNLETMVEPEVEK
jgi:predicted  nucleic acid-binding Zn-ribbon protein